MACRHGTGEVFTHHGSIEKRIALVPPPARSRSTKTYGDYSLRNEIDHHRPNVRRTTPTQSKVRVPADDRPVAPAEFDVTEHHVTVD